MKPAHASILAISLGLTLSACVGRPVASDVAEYTLPTASAGVSPLLRSLEVGAASWLGGKDMAYRLAYADADRRSAYGGSRWLASPPEMLERFLARSLTGEGGGQGGAVSGLCRLRLDLDEFQQVFDSPQASRGVLAARVSLLAQSGRPLARHSYSLSRPAPSPDARGGITALGLASGDLSQSLRQWLDGLPPETVQVCRGK
jgi:cholesterol transport system auxiliary component